MSSGGGSPILSSNGLDRFDCQNAAVQAGCLRAAFHAHSLSSYAQGKASSAPAASYVHREDATMTSRRMVNNARTERICANTVRTILCAFIVSPTVDCS